MALVNTDNPSATFPVEGSRQLVRILQGALADENGASSTYDKILESMEAQKFTLPPEQLEVYKDIMERIREIRNDEYQHMGSLIEMIHSLSDEVESMMIKGAEGN